MFCDMKIGLLLFWCCATTINCIQNKAVEQVFMKQVADDLTHSASGYMYRSDGRSPPTYVDLGGNPVPPKKYGLINRETSSPVASAAAAAAAATDTKRQIITPIYTQPNLQIAPTYYKPDKYVGYILPHGEKESFVKADGSKYNQEQYKKHGETGASGYDKKHEFDNGETGQHGNEQHQAKYDTDSGRKAAYDNTVKYYSDADRAAKLNNGENYHESSGHKKGSKTEGFHNVYHKDEYKKDQTFYDESDNRGHYEKYGGAHVQQNKADGAHKSGGDSETAVNAEHQSKQSQFDKGNYLNQAQGHKGVDGKEQYYKEQEQFSKEGAQNDGKQYGYENSDGKYH